MQDYNRLKSILRRCRLGLIALVLIAGPAAAIRVVGADCASAPAGLAGWWAGDGNANDIAGANNGTLQGGATASAPGVVGSAFSFDGTNGYVQIPDSPALKPTNLTVEAWVRFTSLDSAGSGGSPAGQQYIVFKQNSRSGNFEGYDLGKSRLTGGDTFSFRASSSSGVLAETFSTTVVATGVWYHVAGVRGSNSLQLYVNGQLESQTNIGFAQDYGSLPVYFGSSGNTWDHKFKGTLDEVSLYNRALSSSEVFAVYAAGAAGKCKGASIIAPPQSQTALIGTDVTFTVAAAGFGTLSYQWQFNGAGIPGAISTSLALSNVQPTNAGSYTVVVTNSLGSATSAAAVLTVLVPPGITSQPEGLIVTNGTPVSFSVAASGTAPLAYQWRRDGTGVSGATDATYALAAATTNDAGGYTVVVTNVAGAVTSSVAPLTVVATALPFLTAQPASQSVIAGSNAMFSVSAFSALPLGYQWQFNGSDLDGATSTSLALANAQPTNGGDYTVVVTNAQGAVTSAVATLTVIVPPAITAQPASLAAVAGTSVSFSATASGTPPLSYQWRFNGAALGGATGTSLTLSNVQPTNAGSYTVVVTNRAGSATSEVASLIVNLPPAITGQPASQAIVAGSAAAFTVTASGTVPLGYQWLFNGTNLADGGQFSGATSAALSISNVQSANAGAYSVVVTNLVGTATSTAAILMVSPPGTCVSSPAGVVGWWPGDGDANDLAGTNNGSLQGGATASATGLVSSAFGFDGTNSYVQIPDSPVLRPTNLTIEAWVLFSSLDSAGSGGSPAGQQYLVFKQNSHATSFEGFALTKWRVANSDFLDFQVTSASGQSAELVSVSAVTTGVWYHVAAVRGSNTLQLYVNGQLESQTSVSFAQDYGSLPLYFGSSGQSWDHKLKGALDEVSLYNRALSSNEVAAVYAARANGKCRAINITAQPQGRRVAVGANVNFIVAASGSAPLGYQWQRNGVNLADGGNILGANSAVLSLANVSVNDSASYQVLIGNVVGLVTSAAAVLNVDPSLVPPSITNQPASQTASAGTNVTLTVAASGTGPLSYQWLFNGANLADGGQVSGATTAALVINYVLAVNSGAYSVVVTNVTGAVTSTVATLTVTPAVSCLAAPAGLVGWWPGDGTANDIVGTNNGVLQGNGIANAAGFDGQCFSFDGTNGYVQVPDSPVFHPTNLTVECWVRFATYQTPGDTYYSNQQYIVFKQNSRSAEFEGFALTKDHDPQGDVFLWEVASASGELVRIDSISTVVTGVWYHVAGVRGPDYSQLYMNGHLEVQTNVSFPQDYGNFPLYFGTSGQSYYDRRLHAELDEVSLYNRALSGDEIAALYAQGAAGKCKGTNGVGITLQPQSQTAVAGTDVLLTVAAAGIPPLTYQWQFNGAAIAGATSTNLLLAGVQPTNSGNYRVLVKNPAGSVISAGAVLVVAVPPGITVQPTNQTVLAGATVSFSAAASGTAPLSYQWQLNGTNVDGAVGQTLGLTNVQPAQAGNYVVVVSNSGGSAASAVAVLTVLVPPSITLQPTNETVLVGSAANFSVTATGTAPLNYQWQFDGTNLDGAVGQMLSLTNVQPAQAGDYGVVVSNSGGSATSAVAVLTVLVPPNITLQPTNETVLVGSAANFSVTATGTAPLSYQWQFDGTNLDGAVGQMLSLTNVQPAQAGGYSIVVTNSAGSVTSAVAILTVAGPPVLLNARTTTNGTFAFTLCGAAGLCYVIEVTTNLQEWSPLNSVSNATGQAECTDEACSNSVVRFYRARWVR